MLYTLFALFALIASSTPTLALFAYRTKMSYLLIAANQIFLIPIAIILLAYWLLTNYYRKTSVEIQRLESLSRAPVFSHLSETIGTTPQHPSF